MPVIDIALDDNKLTQAIMDCLFQVHYAMGPGLLESVYEECLTFELQSHGLSFERQVLLPLQYNGHLLNAQLRLDIVVENKVILELKSVERTLPVHEAQLLSYLRLADLPIGFLVNFNVPLIKDGVRRMVNKHQSYASPRLRGDASI